MSRRLMHIEHEDPDGTPPLASVDRVSVHMTGTALNPLRFDRKPAGLSLLVVRHSDSLRVPILWSFPILRRRLEALVT